MPQPLTPLLSHLTATNESHENWNCTLHDQTSAHLPLDPLNIIICSCARLRQLFWVSCSFLRLCMGGLHASPHVQAFGYHLPSAQLRRNRSNVAIFNCCNPRTSLVDNDWSNSALLVAFLHDAASPSHVRLCSTRCPSWLARQSESSAVQRKLHVRQCQHSDRTFAPSSLGVLFGPSTILRPHKATFESRSATPGKRER